MLIDGLECSSDEQIPPPIRFFWAREALGLLEIVGLAEFGNESIFQKSSSSFSAESDERGNSAAVVGMC